MPPTQRKAINASTFATYAKNPSAFRNDLYIDVDGIPQKLGECLDEWQIQDFESIDPGLMRCNGRSKADDVTLSASSETRVSRAWLERPRGHSKTQDIGILCTWALAFATRPLRGYAFAADKDQATLLKDAMERIIRLNPWLNTILQVQKEQVVITPTGI